MRLPMTGSPFIRRYSGLLAPAAAAALALAGCGREPDAVRIGISCPITGDQAKIGGDMLHGAELAVMEANAAGGVLGKTVMLYPVDDQHSANQAVAAAHRFVSAKTVLAVVGHLNSACTLPASDIYAKAGVAQVTPCSTNMDITRRGLATIFRMCAHDGIQGAAAAAWAVRKLKLKTAFVLDDKSTYGQGLCDEFTKAAKAAGATIVGRDGLNQGEKDFSSLVTRIKSLKPKVIFFGGMYPEGSLLARQLHEQDVHAVLLGGDGLYDKTLIQLAGTPAAEGTLATMVGADVTRNPAAQAFVKAYEEKFGPVGPYSPYAYDSTKLVIDAIRRAGVADRAKVLAEVRATKGFKGVTGITSFDANGDTTNQTISIYAVKDGQWAYQGLAWGKI